MTILELNNRPLVPSNPFYSSSILSCSTSDLSSLSALSPRALYAESFDRPRPQTSRSLPSSRFRKNMKKMIGLTTEDEFDALPIAVRRKYFSTLERLRFAQNSRSSAFNDLPIQSRRKCSVADRRGLNIPVLVPRRKHSITDTSARRLRKLSRQQSVTSNEASWFLTLPEKIRKKQFTREEQALLAGRLRESVILDAADEAIYKASRRASRNLTPIINSPTSPSSRGSMDSCRSTKKTSSTMVEAMYESFRWMDEEEDLDLRLVLDDYHANLHGAVLPSPSSTRRPSFRRHMSISRIPFGRASLSSIQPRYPKNEPVVNTHNRQKSRTMSLMAPKHTANESISSIDPHATHYQDPEARLKLRVYLASPQKFDEAIEFGFPSMDGVTDADKENRPPKRSPRDQAVEKSFATEKSQTFLNDDTVSLFEDDTSMIDPDSPLTPMGTESDLKAIEASFKPQHRTSPTYDSKGSSSKTSADFSHLGITKPTIVKQPESYTQAMAGSREMTLRMTLTRPDLRADETTLYGWQTNKSPLKEEPLALEDLDEKFDVRGPLGGIDGWGPTEKENGVVKRLWNRVRSSQRKSS